MTTGSTAPDDATAAGLSEVGEADECGEEPVEGAGLVTRGHRESAVAHWLLAAADDRTTAFAQWQEQDVALLACGGILSCPAHPTP
ncbi:hypothetical protein [Streptomyces shenzhenensis]|uniref:hypothetical protein n=1 Tax=Streptomyces shenzhenensis TaxID=943815 RepID=UPI0033C0164C